MTIPFVIDNQQHKMAGVLNDLLARHKGHSLDVTTAYFNVGGWQLLREGLTGLGNFRLLLGDEPEAGSDLGLREIGAKPVKGLIRDLAHESFNEQTLRLVEDLIAFLRQEHVQVRLYTVVVRKLKAGASKTEGCFRGERQHGLFIQEIPFLSRSSLHVGSIHVKQMSRGNVWLG